LIVLVICYWLQKVLPLYKQIKYLRHYKLHLKKLVGDRKGEEIVRSSLFIVSAGTNDFIQNYYMQSNRSTQFTEEEYENYLISNMMKDIKEMKALGARTIAVVGVPPLGCLPIVRTLFGLSGCYDKFNSAAMSFNSKVRAQVEEMGRTLGMKSAYVDVYGPLFDATKNPSKYVVLLSPGLAEAGKGCCGSGIVEFGETCKGLNTCQNPNEYVYWDAVHPSEKMYRIIAAEALVAIKDILN
ncbi:hypothetical protein Taro_047977, partial [Colocasia esculenta]|nr:hypothetical protein [Colocasia esculenta]